MQTAEPISSVQTHPLVSIMMPAYNAEKHIAAAIESILGQTYRNWELLIVNDGSTDGTLAEVERFTDERIRVITQPNRGEAAARNLALENMRGDFVAFLDADDLFEPEHLALTVDYLIQHPACDAVYTDGTYIDPQDQAIEPLSNRRRGPFEGDILDAVVRASDVFGPPICIVLRRGAVVDRQLWFDTGIVIGPDWDFFTRFSETTRFGYIPRRTCRYRLHATSISVSTSQPRRRASLARCREKAIHLGRFAQCSLDTRAYAFYDLLVVLLEGFPERQAEALTWTQFRELPKSAQARLLRLMANQAVLQEGQSGLARKWYRQASALQPLDPRNLLLSTVIAISPAACRWLVRTRQASPAKS